MQTLHRLLLAALLFATLHLRAAELKDFEPREHRDADGNVLLYRLYKPANYDANRKYPLILFLHGAGERGNNNTAQVRDALYFARDEVQKDHPCFVVAPQVPGSRLAFQIAGAQKSFDQTYAADSTPGEWKTYKIQLAKLPTGKKSFLHLVNTGARNAPGPTVSEFRNIRIYEEGAAASKLDLSKLNLDKKQGNGTVGVTEQADTLMLKGDVRVKIPFEYTVTPKSILEFDFFIAKNGVGAVHAIALDTDDFFDYRWANMDWSAKKGARAADPSTPMRLTLEVLEKLQKEFSIDRKRLYITGLSMGGYGTWDIISRHPKLFAAAVPVCGGADETTAPIVKDIPIWCFHGGADTVVPTDRSRNMIKALKDAGGNPRYTEYFGVGHNSWSKAYTEPDLFKWLFEQAKKE